MSCISPSIPLWTISFIVKSGNGSQNKLTCTLLCCWHRYRGNRNKKYKSVIFLAHHHPRELLKSQENKGILSLYSCHLNGFYGNTLTGNKSPFTRSVYCGSEKPFILKVLYLVPSAAQKSFKTGMGDIVHILFCINRGDFHCAKDLDPTFTASRSAP